MSGFLTGRTSLTTVQTADIADVAVTTAKITTNAIDGTLTKDALIGDYSDVTITAADLIMYGDATDSNNTKRDTVQGILDLGGGSWNLIGTAVASSSASLTVTGLDSTYDTYVIAVADMVPATDNVVLTLRCGDSSGIDSGASDYEWGHWYVLTSTSNPGYFEADTADSDIDLNGSSYNVGNASGEGTGMLINLHRPGDGTSWPMFTWYAVSVDDTGVGAGAHGFGLRQAVITLDRVQVLFSSGNIATGRMTVWGIAHA